MKKAVIVVIILTLIITTAGILYWQYISTPKYSLWQARKAFEQHDLASFEKYVDVEGITGSLIDQMLGTVDDSGKPKDDWEHLGESIGKGLITLFKPQLNKLVKQQVAELVETGKFEEKEKGQDIQKPEFSLSGIWNKAGAEKTGFQGIDYVKKEGKLAYVRLKFFQEKYNTNLILDVKMRDRGGYWQVAELSNFGEYMKRIYELETKRIEQLNAPIIEAIKQALGVEKIDKSNKTDSWGIDKKVLFNITLKNNGQKEIDEYKAFLTCKSLDGKELKSLPLADNNNIPPGKTCGSAWSINVNMFIKGDNLLYDTRQSNLDIDANIQYIKFTDGSELKLYGWKPSSKEAIPVQGDKRETSGKVSFSPYWIENRKVNVRSGPSTKDSIITILKQGDKVYSIMQQGEWHKISLGKEKEKVGWVHSSLLSKSFVSPAPTIEIIDIDTKVTESNDVWWKYAWRLTIRNSGSSPVSLTATIEFQDKEGFIIDKDFKYSLYVPVGKEKTFTGYELINADVARNVSKVGAKVHR